MSKVEAPGNTRVSKLISNNFSNNETAKPLMKVSKEQAAKPAVSDDSTGGPDMTSSTDSDPSEEE